MLFFSRTLSALNTCHRVIPGRYPWPPNTHGPSAPVATSQKLSVLDGAGGPSVRKHPKPLFPRPWPCPSPGRRSPPRGALGTRRSRDSPRFPSAPQSHRGSYLPFRSWEKLARQFLKGCAVSQNLCALSSCLWSFLSHRASPAPRLTRSGKASVFFLPLPF